MSRRYANFDWNHARAFLATVEEGSLSAAARALGSTQPTVSRQISALEKALDLMLFERAGRGLTLTSGGSKLLDRLRAMGEAADQISLQAFGQTQRIDGTVYITASVGAAVLLPPVLKKLRESHPGICVNLAVSTSAKDLQRREADIALRHVEPTQPELLAREVTRQPVTSRLYASPTYLERFSHPLTKEDLSTADFLNFEDTDRLQRRLRDVGLPIAAEKFKIVSDDWMIMCDFIRKGLGIGLLPEMIGDHDPSVQRVPFDISPVTVQTWITVHRELHTTPRIRVVYDLLCSELADQASL